MAEYKARVDKTDASGDATISEQLAAVSRYLEQRLGRVFNQSAELARTFDGHGDQELRIDDLVSLAATPAVKVDLDADGTYETNIANGDVLLAPARAAEDNKPYLRLMLAPWQTTINKFAARRRSIQITAVWGWPAVPAPIREATCSLVRQLRDLQKSGFTLTLQNIDAAIRLAPDAARLVDDLGRVYGRKTLVM